MWIESLYKIDDSKFKEHLDSLDENRIYDALTRNQEAVVCAGVDVIIEKKCRNIISIKDYNPKSIYFLFYL